MNAARISVPTRFRQAGFNMIEVLAALLVMGVGIVGIAALYSDDVHQNPDVQLREQAAALAEEIAHEIHGTKEGWTGFASTLGVLCTPKKKLRSAQDAAAQKAACWEDEVERRLPSGLGTITRDVTKKPEQYVISVSWSSPEGGTASYVLRLETTS